MKRDREGLLEFAVEAGDIAEEIGLGGGFVGAKRPELAALLDDDEPVGAREDGDLEGLGEFELRKSALDAIRRRRLRGAADGGGGPGCPRAYGNVRCLQRRDEEEQQGE